MLWDNVSVENLRAMTQKTDTHQQKEQEERAQYFRELEEYGAERDRFFALVQTLRALNKYPIIDYYESYAGRGHGVDVYVAEPGFTCRWCASTSITSRCLCGYRIIKHIGTTYGDDAPEATERLREPVQKEAL